jgi:hypothetical protein
MKTFPPGLPAGFDHARQHTRIGQFPETDAADRKFPDIATRTPATLAAVVFSDLELWFQSLLNDQTSLCHLKSLIS